MIGLVICLSLICQCSFPDFWKVIDDYCGSDHQTICISYTHDILRIPRSPKLNFKRAHWVSFHGVANVDISARDIDIIVSNATRPILHAARFVFRRFLQFTLSMEFHGRKQTAEKHFVSVINHISKSVSSL